MRLFSLDPLVDNIRHLALMGPLGHVESHSTTLSIRPYREDDISTKRRLCSPPIMRHIISSETISPDGLLEITTFALAGSESTIQFFIAETIEPDRLLADTTVLPMS